MIDATQMLLLADKTASPAAWGLLLLCIALGTIIALTPSKRTSEIKRPDE